MHGTGAGAGRWDEVIPYLRDHYSCISYDRRGRGNSTDAATYALTDEIADLIAVLQWAGNGKPVTVVAHSFGAMVALALLQQQPGPLSRIVLYEAPVKTRVEAEFINPTSVGALDATQKEQGNEAAVIFLQREFPRATEQDIER